MTIEQFVEEAIRLTNVEDYAAAAILWQKLSQTPDLDIQHRCLCFLNERRCRTHLGQHEIAWRLLENLEKLDSDHWFRLEVEYGWIDDLYGQGRYAEANQKSVLFAKKYALELASPDFVNFSYQRKLALGCGFVHAEDFASGLQLLTEILSAANESDDKRRILYYRSLAYKGLNQEAAEVDDLQQIIQSEESDSWAASAHYDLGIIYQNTGAFALAKYHLQIAESFKKMLTFPVSYVYLALSNVCSKRHELNEAKHYKELAESEPE
jgi:tetratricopeptide (TPR) repeat protein